MVDRFVVVPASYVFLLRDRQVLLQLRRGTGYMDEHWAAAAAGHVERGETPYAAAQREATEELGITDVRLEPLTAMARTGSGGPIDERVDYFFTGRHWSGEPRIMEPSKCAELRWCDVDALDALPQPVVPHERSVLDALARSLSDPDAPPVPSIVSFGFR